MIDKEGQNHLFQKLSYLLYTKFTINGLSMNYVSAMFLIECTLQYHAIMILKAKTYTLKGFQDRD